LDVADRPEGAGEEGALVTDEPVVGLLDPVLESGAASAHVSQSDGNA
jgi:hypothetical protein